MFYIATRRKGWDRDSFVDSGRQPVERTLAWAGPELRRTRCLDLGCGLGRTAVHFATHFESVDAIDISPVMIDRARRLDPPGNIRFHVGNGTDLRVFDDGVFDLVFSNLVFQHIGDVTVITRYLAEVARVLTPAGRAALQFDTRRPGLISRIYEGLPDVLPGRTCQRFVRRYRRTPQQVRSFFAEAGLELIDERDPGTAKHVVLCGRA